MQLSLNFTLDEMLYSDTAKRHGFRNDMHDPDIIVPNLKALCEKVLQPTRDHFGPLVVSSGYSNNTLSLLLGRKLTSQHCFDDKTEILTTTGWKSLKNISLNDIPFSYNIQTGFIEKDELLDIIMRPYKGILFGTSTKNIDYRVTDKHRMLVAYTPHENKAPKWFIEEASKCHNKRLLFLTSALINNIKSCYNLDMLKLCMAIIADGCVYQKKNTNSPIIRFNISKQRKIDFLENLFQKLNITYQKRYCSSREKQGQFGVYEITLNQTNALPFVNIIGPNKLIPNWFLDLSSDELKELVYTYSFFDGSKDIRNTDWTYQAIFSKNKHNIDMLQAMCIMSGLRASISYREGKSNFGDNHIYEMSFVPKNVSRVNEDKYFTENYDGYVWCIQTKNSTLICRRNGKAFVCGNCRGQAADIVSKRVLNYDIAKWISEHLDFDQLIYECRRRGVNGPYYDWVHVSYRNDGKNRNEVLYSPPGGGYRSGLPEKSYV